MGITATIERRAVEHRASIENPSTSLANPSLLLSAALGAVPTTAGVSVSEQNALNFATVFGCVRAQAEDVAKLPLPTYTTTTSGKRKAPEHPNYRLLHDRPNPEMTSFTFRETLQAHLGTWGNAYAEKEMDQGDRVIWLWPLPPDRVRVVRQNGQKVYIVTLLSGEEKLLLADQVFHVPGMGYDGLRGYSPIKMAKQAIGLGMAQQEFSASFFGQGARLSGVLTHPGHISSEASLRLKDDIRNVYSGLSNAHRVALLEEGVKWEQLGVEPEAAQFLQSRTFQVSEIARFYRMPLHKIQELSHATFSNIEQQNIEYVVDTLTPWLVRWEQVINWDLFPEVDRGRYFAKFTANQLMRGDSAARAAFYSSGIQNGYLSINNVLDLEDMNGIGPAGDQHFVQLNLVPVDAGGPPPTATGAALARMLTAGAMKEQRTRASITARHRIQQAHAKAIEVAATKLVGMETRDVENILSRTMGTRDAQDFLAAIRKFYEGFSAEVRRQFEALLQSLAEMVQSEVAAETGTPAGVSADMAAFIARYAAATGDRHVRKSLKQIQDIVAASEPETLVPAITGRMQEWRDKRPGKIGLAESVRAAGAFALAAYAAAGTAAVRWNNVGASCPLCDNLDGMVVSVRQPFVSAGDTVRPATGDGDVLQVYSTLTHPPLHGGCDCILSAA